MTTFVDDEKAYLAWVEAHRGGYVLNCARSPTPDYLKLHQAICKFISTSTRSNWTTGEYIKVCSEDLGELRRWAADQVGGNPQRCQSCMRDRKPSPGAARGHGGSTVLGGGSSRPLTDKTVVETVKTVVEFAAALIAVVGGIVAFIKWIL
jgi:hypothetical protein